MSGVKGRSGRKKKTDAEKMALGVRTSRIAGDIAPDRVMEHPIKLNWLNDESRKEASIIFEYYETMLYNNGTLSASDGIAYNALCEAYQRWIKAKDLCDKHGRYSLLKQVNADGTPSVSTKLHAWARDEADCFSQLIALCREFGLTPLSRSSVEKIVRGEKINPFAGITI